MFYKGDIIKFDDPWLKNGWLKRFFSKQPKYVIMRLSCRKEEQLKHNDLFVVEDYFQHHLIIKKLNDLTSLCATNTNKFLRLSDEEIKELKRKERRDKLKKIVN